MYKTIFALLTSSGLMLAGPSPSLGVAKSSGNFLLDGVSVYSNATIFDGSVIATQDLPAVIRLSSGETTISPNSRVSLHNGTVTVEKGSVLTRNQVVESGSLHIAPSSSAARLRIEVLNVNRVAVSASGGQGVVSEGGGVIATLQNGAALSFTRNPEGRTVVGPFSVTQIGQKPVLLLSLPTPVSKR